MAQQSTEPNTQSPQPLLHTIAIDDLRPTQMTVGMREVERKRADWKKLAPAKTGSFLGNHMIPVVRGPKNRYYVIDHHHLARALHDEGVAQVLISPVADLRALDKQEFWRFMDNRGWTHPFDADGERQPRTELPKSISDLADDPYRSLAGELRFAGGYAKDATPFSEFLWADALRLRVDAKTAKNDAETALTQALQFAKSPEASYLPGWCGPHARS
ncbi:MAG: ParB-like protein [Hyphomicrobium sp.]|uniref:ParB-like protein n=1 Tax=Hyphomicrobium sp. TaxID=82 RepID=UPI0039E65D2A